MSKDIIDVVIQKLAHMDQKLDRMEEKQSEQAVVLAKNTLTLEEHVKRTNILEAEVKPIKSHVQMVNWAAKIGLILVGLAETLHQLGLF